MGAKESQGSTDLVSAVPLYLRCHDMEGEPHAVPLSIRKMVANGKRLVQGGNLQEIPLWTPKRKFPLRFKEAARVATRELTGK
jgi:hypothetical protein